MPSSVFLTELRNSMLNSSQSPYYGLCRPKFIVLRVVTPDRYFYEVVDISLYRQGEYFNVYRGFFSNDYDRDITVDLHYIVGETISGNPTKDEIKKLFMENSPSREKYILDVIPKEPYVIPAGAIQGYEYTITLTTE